MITTVVIEELEKGVPPPKGNGFPVYAHSVDGKTVGPWRIDSGLSFITPREYPFRLESAGRFIVTGWTFKACRLIVLVDTVEPEEAPPVEMEQVSTAWFGDYERLAVRFIERPREGGRVIRGDAKVVDSVESGDSESGE